MSVSWGCQKDFHDVTFNLCQGVALIGVKHVDVKEQTDRRLEHQFSTVVFCGFTTDTNFTMIHISSISFSHSSHESMSFSSKISKSSRLKGLAGDGGGVFVVVHWTMVSFC